MQASHWVPAFAGMTGLRATSMGSRLRGNDKENEDRAMRCRASFDGSGIAEQWAMDGPRPASGQDVRRRGGAIPDPADDAIPQQTPPRSLTQLRQQTAIA